jgi:ABC-type nickel/cobalt efflux system permease component RcnA
MTRFLAAVLLPVPFAVHAHPLGNFTINRYAALTVSAQTLSVHYVVDMAEIPTFQEIATIDADHDGSLSDGERGAYVESASPALGGRLHLTVDGRPLVLTLIRRSFELPPGAGGLPTLRLDLVLTAELPAARGVVEFRDANFAGRPGWQEVVAEATDGLALVDSTVPRTDRSAALRAYPSDLLTSPPQVTEARFAITTGGRAPLATTEPAGEQVGAARYADRLTELIARREPLSLGFVLGALLLAAALGALHALGPGHGKAIVGAYLVGTRGSARHALFLGLVVTITHTLGVYALGLVTLGASHWIVPERLFPWLSAASGLLVLAIGASLASARLGAALGEEHHHAEDHHHHDGHHHHGHGHTHLPRDGAGLGWKSLLALGVSGGLLPCPSALVVMLGAIALGRVAFGLLLIVAFSVGLAGVLTGVGLVFLYGRRWFDEMPLDGRVARYVPVASALAISLAGILIIARALGQILPALG